MNLSNYAVKLLKDAANNQGRFELMPTLNGWKTPYGDISNPQECREIQIAHEQLREYGFIRELTQNGGLFEITASGLDYTQKL